MRTNPDHSIPYDGRQNKRQHANKFRVFTTFSFRECPHKNARRILKAYGLKADGTGTQEMPRRETATTKNRDRLSRQSQSQPFQ
ncbi:MAG: hypothetical protein ACPHJ3_10600, partial [Rubripirellula sp.]